MNCSPKHFDLLAKTAVGISLPSLHCNYTIMKKIVLITGASSGMGKETALLLAQNGYIVYGAARRVDKMSGLQQAGITTLAMDVTNEESMVDGINQIIAKEGKIDILINNAGFGSYGAVEDVAITDARYQLEVNLFGAARLIQLVLPYMRQQCWGKIVNISSIGGKIATPFGGWYHASKFALEGLSDSMRNEVRPFGIDIILIEPGGIKTEWGSIAFDNLIKNSSNSAYKEPVTKFANSFKDVNDKTPEPIIIARLIKKSIEAAKPKARYSAGYMAKPALIGRKLLSDRIFDKMMMSQIK
jgi:NAD(P)-dependent dehydrogenase (short-subunit alcohol dehydrogenase family)